MGISAFKTEATSKWLLRALNAGLSVALGTAVFVLVRDAAISRYVADKPIKKEAVKAKGQDKKALTDYSAIVKNNPFGGPSEELKAITPATETKQVAAVQATEFTLIGTVVAKGIKSYAIFQDKDGHQDIFKTGSFVFGTGILKSVSKNSAVVEIDGNPRELKLADGMVVKDFKEKHASAAPPPMGGASIGMRKEGTFSVLDQGRIQQALENPKNIMSDARFIPFINGNKQEGFTISEVRPGGIYSSLGLMNGDVIQRVNEYSMSSPETALQAFTAIKGMERIQLDIIRAGNKMTLTYLIK